MATRSTTLIACFALLTGATSNAATVGVTSLAPNSLVVTEYLANPVGVGDADGEYFEIYNTTGDSIDLDGLVVRDDGANAFTVPSLVVAPYSFAVFSSSDGTSLGLIPDHVYGGSMALTNGDDEIGLYRPDDMLINKVAYTDGDGFGAGIAHELDLLHANLPAVTGGPALGGDFIAATSALPLGNFGSPGSAGGTRIEIAAVPLPAGAWLFVSALSAFGWIRHRK